MYSEYYSNHFEAYDIYVCIFIIDISVVSILYLKLKSQ